MNRARQTGYNIIEVVIVVGVLALLLGMGVPLMSEWIANSRVRTAAEGMLNGLQYARAEAVRRNALVDLQIGADGVSWDVVLLDGTNVQTRPAEAGTGITATATATPAGATTVRFNGMGAMVAPASIAIRYTSAAAGARAMCATVTSNTPRMCDPQRTDATDPQACFTGGAPIAGC